MKILQLNREYLARLGIQTSQLVENHSIETKNLINYILLSLNVLLGFLYLCYDAKNIEEYVICIFWITTSVSVLFDYILYVENIESLFKCLENFESLIQKSKLNTQ